MKVHDVPALGFDAHAAAHEDTRPGYPDAGGRYGAVSRTFVSRCEHP